MADKKDNVSGKVGEELRAFVDEKVRSREYKNMKEVLQTALTLLQYKYENYEIFESEILKAIEAAKEGRPLTKIPHL